MREKYESLSAAVLKDLAKARGMKGLSGMKKSEVIERMLYLDEQEKQAADRAKEGAKPESAPHTAESGTGPESSSRVQEHGRMESAPHTAESARPESSSRVQEHARAESAPQAAESIKQESASRAQEHVRSDAAPRTSERMRPEGRMQRSDGSPGARPQRGDGNGARQGNAGRVNAAGRRLPRPGQQDGNAQRQRNARKTGYSNYPNSQQGSGNAGGQAASQSAGMAAPSQGQSYEGGYSGSRQEFRAHGSSGEPYAPGPVNAMEQGAESSAIQPNAAGGYAQQSSLNGQSVSPVSVQEGGEGDTRLDRPPVDLAQLDSGQQVSGILEVMADGFGFIRSDNYMPGENDVYVSPSQIRRFNLKTGDIIGGNTRIKTMQEKFSALLYLKTINGRTPSEAAQRSNFEDMTPIFPNERLCMERGSRAIAMRIVDLLSPIGKGQRGMIVSPPKAGKTTLLKDVARSILENDPKMKLIILLIDERPEEVTDIKEAIQGENVEVIYSTFDELPEHHKRVSEMVIERAKRLVEHHENVTILLDSITRLARAYNMTVPPSGRTLSGGLDPAALHMPKRFFGAARNMREGGSLTILATALVDTGSKMDDVVYEEFKGTGNMELVLDRKLSERRVFPAIDIPKSGTRREDLLLDREEQEAVYIMRRALNGMKGDEAVENILNLFVHTRDNRELVQRVRRQKYV